MNQQPVLPRPSSGDKTRCRAARVVLGLPDSPRVREVHDYFLDQGWEVHPARSGGDARRLARKLCPTVTVLDADGHGGESGWLTCAKLVMERPGLRVVLVGEQVAPRADRLASFVGAAAYLPLSGPLEALERIVLGSIPRCRN